MNTIQSMMMKCLTLLFVSLIVSCSSMSTSISSGTEGIRANLPAWVEPEDRAVILSQEPGWSAHQRSPNFYEYGIYWNLSDERRFIATGKGGLDPFDPDKARYMIVADKSHPMYEPKMY